MIKLRNKPSEEVVEFRAGGNFERSAASKFERYSKAYKNLAEYFRRYSTEEILDGCLTTDSCRLAHLLAFATMESLKTNMVVNFDDFERNLKK